MIHSHQGVTTILAGNCGNSPVDLDGYFQSIDETGIALNLGLLIGHNSVRSEIMGNENRAPTQQEQVQMEALVKSAMDSGAFGMSTGLIYLPGTYSETGEIISLARVVAKQDGIYASHIRNEFELIIEAIEEAITIGREANIPVHISHYKVADNTMWGDSTITLGLVEAARAEGLDISQLFDFLKLDGAVSGECAADVEADFDQGDPLTLNGDAQVNCGKMTIPRIDLDTVLTPVNKRVTLRFAASAENGVVAIKRLRLVGTAYRITGAATIRLSAKPEKSAVNGSFAIVLKRPPTVKGGGASSKTAQYMVDALVGSGSEIVVDLSGSISNPNVKLTADTPVGAVVWKVN